MNTYRGNWDQDLLNQIHEEMRKIGQRNHLLIGMDMPLKVPSRTGWMFFGRRIPGEVSITEIHNGEHTLAEFMRRIGTNDWTKRSQILASICNTFMMTNNCIYNSDILKLILLSPHNIYLSENMIGAQTRIEARFSQYYKDIFFEQYFKEKLLDGSTGRNLNSENDWQYISPLLLSRKIFEIPEKKRKNAYLEASLYSLAFLIHFIFTGETTPIKKTESEVINEFNQSLTGQNICKYKNSLTTYKDLLVKNIKINDPTLQANIIQVIENCFKFNLVDDGDTKFEFNKFCKQTFSFIMSSLVFNEINIPVGSTIHTPYIDKGNGVRIINVNQGNEIIQYKEIDLKKNSIVKVLNEYSMLKECQCPGAVEVKGFYKTRRSIEDMIRGNMNPGEYGIIAMEYCDLGTLREYIQREGYITPELIGDVFYNLVNALFYVHTGTNHIIHRGINIDSILLITNPNGGKPLIKITDLGKAKIIISQTAEARTKVGEDRPSDCPEINGEQGAQTYKVDVYSIGSVMYSLITASYSTFKFKGLSQQQRIILEGLGNPIYFEEEIWSKYEDLKDLIIGMLKGNPQERIGWHEILRSRYYQKLHYQYLRTQYPQKSEKELKEMLMRDIMRKQYGRLYDIFYPKN